MTGRKGIWPVKNWEWWGAGMVVCLERGAGLHMAQLMSLLLTVSCLSKIQIGFTFLVLGQYWLAQVVLDKGPLNGCVCVCVCLYIHVGQNKETMLRVLQAVDRANGYAYSGSETDSEVLSFLRSSAAAEFEYDKIGAIQEQYTDDKTQPLMDVDTG